MALFPTLRPGDHLLYRSTGLIAWLIRLFSHADIYAGGKGGPTHIEVFVGWGRSFASRDGIGVDLYPFRTKGLVAVLRPTQPLDMTKALRYAETIRGAAYDWSALTNFPGTGRQGGDDPSAFICSEAVTLFDRAGGFDPFFRGIPASVTTPGMFLASPNFAHLWEDF